MSIPLVAQVLMFVIALIVALAFVLALMMPTYLFACNIRPPKTKWEDFLALTSPLYYLVTRVKYRCPRCNYPVDPKHNRCLNCGQPLEWELSDKKS